MWFKRSDPKKLDGEPVWGPAWSSYLPADEVPLFDKEDYFPGFTYYLNPLKLRVRLHRRREIKRFFAKYPPGSPPEDLGFTEDEFGDDEFDYDEPEN